jgi:hypothetical protein
MAWHHLRVLALAAVTAACAGRSQPHPEPPVAPPRALDAPTLLFPDIDPVTLDSLHALLGRIAQDSALLSSLSPSEPRMYALFRELEAAQRAFAIALATPDTTGRTLYDRIMETTERADALFRQLEELHRKRPRP